MSKIPFALFDVLGFKEFIKSKSIEEVKLDFHLLSVIGRAAITPQQAIDALDARADLREVLKAEKLCGWMQYSDSILLYGKDESPIETENVLNAARILLSVAAVQGMLLRGAADYGDIDVDQEMNLVLGEPLVRAYECEQSQQWSGCIVSSAIEAAQGAVFRRLLEARAIVRYPVPLKSGKRGDLPCLNWPSRIKGDLRARLLPGDGYGLQWDAHVKRSNTLAFFDKFRA